MITDDLLENNIMNIDKTKLRNSANAVFTKEDMFNMGLSFNEGEYALPKNPAILVGKYEDDDEDQMVESRDITDKIRYDYYRVRFTAHVSVVTSNIRDGKYPFMIGDKPRLVDLKKFDDNIESAINDSKVSSNNGKGSLFVINPQGGTIVEKLSEANLTKLKNAVTKFRHALDTETTRIMGTVGDEYTPTRYKTLINNLTQNKIDPAYLVKDYTVILDKEG